MREDIGSGSVHQLESGYDWTRTQTNLKKRLDNVVKIWDNINVRVREEKFPCVNEDTEDTLEALWGCSPSVAHSRSFAMRLKWYCLKKRLDICLKMCEDLIVEWVGVRKPKVGQSLELPSTHGGKRTENPLETNLWELEVSQSCHDLLSHVDKQEKGTYGKFHCSGGVRFPSRDSFLTPFSMDRCYYDRRARYWEGSKKKRHWRTMVGSKPPLMNLQERMRMV